MLTLTRTNIVTQHRRCKLQFVPSQNFAMIVKVAAAAVGRRRKKEKQLSSIPPLFIILKNRFLRIHGVVVPSIFSKTMCWVPTPGIQSLPERGSRKAYVLVPTTNERLPSRKNRREWVDGCVVPDLFHARHNNCTSPLSRILHSYVR